MAAATAATTATAGTAPTAGTTPTAGTVPTPGSSIPKLKVHCTPFQGVHMSNSY